MPGQVSDGDAQRGGEGLSMMGNSGVNLIEPQSAQISDRA